MRRFLKYYLPLIIWMVIIFSFSEIEGNGQAREVDIWFYIQRKGAHIFEYFVLAFLIFRVADLYNVTKKEGALLALVFSFAYAVSDEIHQLFVPGRDGKLSDVGIDLIGIVLMVVIWNIWNKRRMLV
ncbi:VanZ family protein [Patescibacteria group bacterium]